MPDVKPLTYDQAPVGREQAEKACVSNGDVLGAQAIVGGEFDLSRLRPGFALDQMFWLTEAYIAEQSALPHIDAEEALYYIARANKAWSGIKHEDVIFGGKDREEGQKVLARGLAWLTLLNGEMEFAGKKLVSPIGRLSSRFAQADASRTRSENSQGEETKASQSDSTKENPVSQPIDKPLIGGEK
jgi:hypothetical protein